MKKNSVVVKVLRLEDKDKDLKIGPWAFSSEDKDFLRGLAYLLNNK